MTTKPPIERDVRNIAQAHSRFDHQHRTGILPKYEKYESVDLGWEERLPASWSALRLKHLVRLVRRPVQDSDEIVTCFRDGTVTLRSNRRTDGFTNADKEIGYQGVRKGDLVIHAMDAFAGAIGVSDSDGKSTPVYSVCMAFSEKASARFLAYALREVARRGYITALGQGIRERSTDFRWTNASEVRLPVPSIEEQRLIAAFLDYETARIDELVREQQRLLTLLWEKQEATISRVVRRGLNDDAAIKDSGVEWIGSIPAHWAVLPLKRDACLVTSGSRGWASYYSDNGALFIRIGNLTRTGLTLDLSDSQRVNVPPGAEGERTRVQAGDVLFSITAYLGSVAIAPIGLGPAFVSQHVALVRLHGNLLSSPWVGFVTLSSVGSSYLDSQGYGGGKIQLSLEDIKGMLIPVPPLAEQHAITQFLDAELKRLEALRNTAKQTSTLLQERRSALITAAVTGQIDIRDWQPPEQAALEGVV
jgi:type I restriction enzyme S subunit